MLHLLLALSLTPDALTDRMLDMLTPEYHQKRSEFVQWGYCRRAPGGCEARTRAFADAFIASGRAYDIDPLVLAAVAWEESRYKPTAGKRGELGIMQVHPSAWKAARTSQFALERERCLRKTDACQPEIVAIGAEILRKSIDMCGGDVWQGVAVYHTGQRRFCEQDKPGPYVRRVIGHWRVLGGQEKRT